MHVRANLCQTDQLGLWIRYYVEPVLLHTPSNSDGGLVSPMPDKFRGWEEFLRQHASDSDNDGAVSATPTSVFRFHWKPAETRGTGMHSGELWNLLYDPHAHFLTAFVYVLYIWIFQAFARQPIVDEKSRDRCLVALACFAVVHLSFFAFTWIAHSGPEMFELKLLPFANAWASGYIVPLYYFPPCIALVLLNWPYVSEYWRLLHSTEREPIMPSLRRPLGNPRD